MKKILLASLLAFAGITAKADYQIQFITFNGPQNNHVFDVDGTTKLSGSTFLGQLYTGTSAGALSAIGTPTAFLTGAGAGFIEAIGALSVTSGTIFGGTSGFYQLRVWNAAGGATYEAASATIGAKTGTSLATAVTFGGNPSSGPGAPITPPQANLHSSFSLSTVAVPEPATIALGLFGAAGLLIRRRK